MKTDILIIGGGIAGTTAAETFRSGDTEATVTIVSEEKHPLYSRVLLPHVVKGKVPEEKVYLKPEDFYASANIQYVTGARVTNVDPDAMIASLNDGSSIGFKKLVIATGGQPKVWEVPGADLDGILQLQTVEDITSIRDQLSDGGDMIIVGTGFIAMEFASFAIHSGIKATILNRGSHFCSSVFSGPLGKEIQAILESQGVTILDNAQVEKVLGTDSVEGVVLKDGKEISCQTIGLGIGLDLNTTPFESVGTASGVLANASLKTSHENIWVAGDCCEFDDPLLGFRHVVGNWTNAMAQGRHVGKAMLGDEKPYEQLTAYTSRCVPGASLIYLGEIRTQEGVEREVKVLEAGKVVQVHRKNGRLIGTVLLNAPEYRANIAESISTRVNMTLEALLNSQ